MPGKRNTPSICEGCGEAFLTWAYKVRAGEGKFCKRACQGTATKRQAPDRFWANVNKNGPVPGGQPDLGPCWLWTAHTMNDGYGQFRWEGRDRPAHVVAYILTYGDMPEGRPFGLHRCDVRPCVRPDHIYAGTHAENMADMTTKGRAATGDRNGARLYPERKPRGDQHPSRLHPERLPRGAGHQNAKLTEAIVIEARRRYAAGGITMQALATWAGVSKPVMHKVIRRRAWVHVP
jgi:hypothetical protein